MAAVGEEETVKIKKSDRFKDSGGVFKVMAVADGWCMCRRPACLPFVRSAKEVGESERVKT